MRRLSALLSFCLAGAVCFAGATLYVDDDGPNDPGPGDPLVSDPAEDGSQAHPFDAIQQTIDAAANGDEVIILPGTYTGEGNRDIDFKGKAITVRGSDPDDPNVVAATIIDCQGTEAEPHRGFYFHTGESQSSVLKGMTVTQGYHQTGGAILCDHSNPWIGNCNIVGNIASNQTYFDKGGGGILCLYSSAIIENCSLENNTGGGVCAAYGSPRIANCRIMGNMSSISGGGIRTWQSETHIRSCMVAHNSKAGIAFYYESGEIVNSVVFLNSPGGILVYGQSPRIVNCVVSGNTCPTNGGGMYFSVCSANVFNCTLVGNRAAGKGGGIFCDDMASLTLSNSIVWGNDAALGSQIAGVKWDRDLGEPLYSSLNASYSDIQGGIAGIPDFREAAYNYIVDVDPLFADAGRWDDDKWIDGDYHLKSYAGRWNSVQETWVMDSLHSPCIDAGDPTSDYSQEPADNGDRLNMGAYGNTPFASKTPSCPQPPVGDLDADCKVTFADLALFAANWLDCNLEPPIACE